MTSRVIDRTALRERLYPRVGFAPHAGQRAIIKSPARHRVAACGRRFGKSYVGGNTLVEESLITRMLLPQLEAADRRREFWIVGPNYTDAEKEFRVAYNGLKRLNAPFDRPGTYNDPHSGDMRISLYGGRFVVIGKSAAKPESLVGEGLNGVIMAEAAKQKQSTWTKFIRPMLADFGGWSLHTSTPEGRNWFYELWKRGQSEFDNDWESWRMPSWRNPFVYPGGGTQKAVDEVFDLLMRKIPVTDKTLETLGLDLEIGALAKDLSKETFNQEVAAKFSEFVGRVFKDFDEEEHVKHLEYQPNWETYAAVDYGFTNPFVWLLLQVDPRDGTVHVLDEFYESGLTIDEAIMAVRSRGLAPSSIIRFYPDPASPGDTKAISKALKLKAGNGTGGELKTRLRLIRAALKVRHPELEADAEERKPKLLIDPKCVNMVREMNEYRYPKTAEEAAELNKGNVPEAPLKKDDHTPEALGRFFAGYFTTPERGGSRVSSASWA